jgi:hypothetical protein
MMIRLGTPIESSHPGEERVQNALGGVRGNCRFSEVLTKSWAGLPKGICGILLALYGTIQATEAFSRPRRGLRTSREADRRVVSLE